MRRHMLPALRILALATLLLSCPLELRAQRSGDILPFRATEATLENGLKVVVVPTGFPNLVGVRIVVQAGSRNEVEPGKSGFAHFFEHLMFRGTPQNPPQRYQQIMAAAGARENAVTRDDHTAYHSTFAKEDLPAVLGLYADMFQNLSYSEADFKTESRAILGEYNKNSADSLQKLYEAFRAERYQRHPYKHTTLGFLKDIENFPNEYAYSKQFFRRWYQPQHTIVVVAGDVVPEQVLSLVRTHWGSWRATSTERVPEIPQDPPSRGPVYKHVTSPTGTLPWLAVSFPAPRFGEQSKEAAATDVLSAIYFGETSDLYKKLVVTEQKVDQLQVDNPWRVDPTHVAVFARLKNTADAVYVRDQIVAAFVQARTAAPKPQQVDDAKSYTRYSFARTIDSTERVTTVVADFVSYARSYQTVNNYFRTMDALTPTDLLETAKKYFTDNGLVVVSLSKDPLAPELGRLTAQNQTAAPARPAPSHASVPLVLQASALPQLNVKLLFTVGSVHDPVGKEGLAALTAAMMTRAGSKAMPIDQIDAALYPTASSFRSQTDKEMTTFTGIVHRDHWRQFVDVALPQLLDPGWRQEDFTRLKTMQMNALVQDLRSDNEEELGKERLQGMVFRGTRYEHVNLGTIAGLNAITLDDVKAFAARIYTRANLTIGVNGDVPKEAQREIEERLAGLPAGPGAPQVTIEPRRSSGLHVEILEKDTRATAISLGFPIAVTRSHPDFAALSIARSWLGEHRMPFSHLYQRIREVRGMNYGDYAYIEAFPGGMFTFFPNPNVGRHHQIFEMWIRPVAPDHAQMALKIAVHEFRQMVRNGLTKDQFETTRSYLMKNVYVMTARQDQQIGYALDSRWYGTSDFTDYMRAALQQLTVDQVNAAIRRHLSSESMSIVVVTKDATALKKALVADAFLPVRYEADKPKALLEEDALIGAMKLAIPEGNVTITPITEVFAR